MPMNELEKLMAAVVGQTDQMDTHFKHEHGEGVLKDEDEYDIGMLRNLAKEFDDTDLSDENVRRGMALACMYLMWLGDERACCVPHGKHLKASANFFLAVVAKEREWPK